MQVKKQVTIRIPVAAEDGATGAGWSETLDASLKKAGYRETTVTPDSVVAIGGSHFWSLFNAGDPRRMHHKIEMTRQETVYTVDTWFGFFSRKDTHVFECEAGQLRNASGSGDSDLRKLEHAVMRANREGILVIAFIFVVAALLGVIAAKVLFGLW